MGLAVPGCALLAAVVGAWPQPGGPAATMATDAGADPFAAYLEPVLADGFDLPVADGDGGTDLGQPVKAIGRGLIVFAAEKPQPWGKVVEVDHQYLENHEVRRVRSLYGNLASIDVRDGQTVERGQPLGTLGKDPASPFFAHLPPTEFLLSHRQLPVPTRAPTLLLVHHASQRMRVYAAGQLQGEYEVGLGQAPGPKQVRGDLKTPVGLYYVVERSRGPFAGAFADFYGGHWIKLNYPNAHDAARGLAAGLLSKSSAAEISARFAARELTPQRTNLGGGIGFHGWAGEWTAQDGGTWLSWGCVVMHNPEIASLYDRVPSGAMVILF